MNNKKTVVLATKSGNVDNAVIRIIKSKHGTNTRIRFVRSSRVFNTDSGFTTLIQQNRNTATVYAIREELPRNSFETAVKTGLAFCILNKDANKGWNIFHRRENNGLAQ